MSAPSNNPAGTDAALTAILPCPFCGSSGIKLAAHPNAGQGLHHGETIYSLDCMGCGASAVNRYSEQVIVDAWNRRTPALITDTALTDLRDHLAAAQLGGTPITLSPEAAGALHLAMTTPPAADVCAEMRALCSGCGGTGDVHSIDGEWRGECTCALAVAQREAAGNERLFMAACVDLGLISEHLRLDPNDGGAAPIIEAIDALRAGVPAGWRAVPIEPTEDMVIDGFESPPDRHFDGDAYPEEYDAMSGCQQAAFRAKRCWAAMLEAAPAAPQYAEDPVDIIRTLLCAVDGYHRRTSAFEPSPIANNSPVILAARRACVERGFTAGGLAIEPAPSGDA